MWTCPGCNRRFKTANQWHSCGETTIDEIFAKSSDELILTFDRILTEVVSWEPCTVGAAKKAVVFTSKKAWLILRPLKKELDLKFYCDQPIESDLPEKVRPSFGKFAHHIRLQNEEQVTSEVIDLLRQGFEYSLR